MVCPSVFHLPISTSRRSSAATDSSAIRTSFGLWVKRFALSQQRSIGRVGHDIHDGSARLTEHESAHSPFLVAQGIGDLKALSTAIACTASTSGTSTVIPGAAMSSPPTIVIWTDWSSGSARVVTQPRSIATSKPNSSTKKVRVSLSWSDRMLGTALVTVISVVLFVAGHRALGFSDGP
jgi:hypothetical protein